MRALVRHVLEDHAGALRNDALPSIARTRVADDPTARTRRQVCAIKVACVEHRAEIVPLVPPFPGVNLDRGYHPPLRFDTSRSNTDTNQPRRSLRQPELPMDWLAVWRGLFGRQSGRLLG